MTGKVKDMAPCLKNRVELDNCFSLMFFLDVLLNFLSFICVTEFSWLCWYHFHVVHIAVMCKNIHIKNETWIFCTFRSANPKFIHQYHVFFLLCSIWHAFANPLCFLKWFLCFDSPYTVIILIYPHWFLLYPLQSLLASCRSFLPCSTHTYTPF